MAVLDAIPEIKVCLCVDGIELKEYACPDDEAAGALASKTVTKYVEAVPDPEFSIRLSVKKGYKIDRYHISFHARVDGLGMETSITTKQSNVVKRRMDRKYHWCDLLRRG